MTAIIMPQVGQDISAGKIVQWLKSEGDQVEAGEVVLVVESEKASFEVESEQSGVLLKILHGEGEEVEILQPVGYIGEPGERVEDMPATAHVGEPATAEPVGGEPSKAVSKEQRLKRGSASPSARRLARELGVDLSSVKGTGPGGRISKQDVQAAAETPEAAPVPAAGQRDTVLQFGKMRRQIAERLTASKRDIPHFYLSIDVDMTEAQRLRRKLNDDGKVHVTVTDLIIKAAATALGKYPRLNAHVCGENMILKGDINIGVAVAVEDGLLVPVIGRADAKSLREISTEAGKNAADARRGMVKPEPVGSFTITSLGMHGVKQFAAIINPPECAILAAGSIEDRAVPFGDGIAVREMMTLTLACDHRAVDGADGAGLLNDIKQTLEAAPVPS